MRREEQSTSDLHGKEIMQAMRRTVLRHPAAGGPLF